MSLFPELASPPPPPEPLSADRRRTQRNRELLQGGIHPATHRPLLAGWGYTCADCAHAEYHSRGARAHWKCRCHRLGLSHSSASDIRVSWPACALLRIDTP